MTRAHRYEPDVNATYAEMAAHYGVAIIPARSYKPRDKAKAEVGVFLAERWIMARLRNRHFTSLGEANLEIAELVAWVNARPFKKLDGSRSEPLRGARPPALRPLPAEPLRVRHLEQGQGQHRLPRRGPRRSPLLLGPLPPGRARWSTSAPRRGTVEVFYRHNRVASHVRSYRPGYTTDPAHMPESHRRHAALDAVAHRRLGGTRPGPRTAKLAEAIMAARPHPEQGFRTCLGIIRLGERYGTDRLEAACTRALAVRSYSYRSVESILRTGLDKKPLPGRRTRARPIRATTTSAARLLP